jgi:broad specificity phosphatase PhoE
MALTLYLLRHGETEASRTGGYCGKLDIELSAEGRLMAEDFASAYAGHSFAGVYASPLRRTRDTVAPLCRATGRTPEFREGLRELEYGAWEGLSPEAVSRDHGEDYLRWLADAGWNAPTGGERGIDVGLRAMAVLEEIWRNHPDGDVLVVSHKATIRILLCQLIGVDLGRYRDRINVSVASLSVVEMREHGPLLTRLGDRSHLRPALRDLPGT